MTRMFFAGVAAGVFGLDVCLKNHVERMTFPASGEKRLSGGRVIISRLHNEGAMLGIGKQNRALLATISVAMTCILLVLFICSLGRHGNNCLRIGLSALLGGAFSNTYDRLKRKYVVDYISFRVPWKRQNRLVFNIADFCIIIGALLSAVGGMQ